MTLPASPFTVVDTDILIDMSRKVDQAVECVEELLKVNALAVSVVTHMEIIAGCANKAELRTWNNFMLKARVLPVDTFVSDKAIELMQTYNLSHGLQIADSLVAATALINGAALISKNQRDYRFIEGLNLLPYPKPNQTSAPKT